MIETLYQIAYIAGPPLVITVLILFVRHRLQEGESGGQSRWRHLRNAGCGASIFAVVLVAWVVYSLARSTMLEYQPHDSLHIISATGEYEYIPALTGRWVLSERSQFFLKLNGISPAAMSLELSPDGKASIENIFRKRNCYLQGGDIAWFTGSAQFRVIDNPDHQYHVEIIVIGPDTKITTVGQLTISGELPYLTLSVDDCDDSSLWQLRKE